jgi:HK97 family phage prohead protease
MLSLFARIAKLDEEKRLVFGYASTEALDSQGEIVRREALEAALPDYMRFANIREMHLPSAVGVAHEAEVDEKGLFLAAKVVDDAAWAKVKEGVYKGFSIGGRVTARDPHDRKIVTGVELTEISLVDRPANPEATIALFKRADGVALTALGGGPALAKVGARNSKADLARIQAIHDQSVDLGACCPTAAAGDADADADGDADDDDALAGKFAKLGAERDRALAALAKLGGQVAPLMGELRRLEKRLALVEAQPLPPKGVLGPAAVLSKEDDRAGPDASSPLAARLRTLPPGLARADEILRHAHFTDR